MSTFVAENATSELLYNVNIEGFMNFFSGMALSDIRIFVLIERFYGSLLPLKYGETLLRLITQLIPRAIWNDKPLDLGIEIGQLFLPGTLSGTPPGFFGEMYMNFHVFGVVFGAFILALILGKLYKIWILENNTRKGELYYAVLISRIALFPSSTIANIVLTLLIHFILMWGIVKISEKRIG
jgi:oligosaccharide repeat unit polymerase